METVFALQPLRNSIFLAGPTPRDPSAPSWRPRALEILAAGGYGGTVFVPESESWTAHGNYDAQIDWEWEALNQATAIAFWVPRDLVTMPAFTTNVEFGYYASSGKLVLGAPSDAPKMGYLRKLAERHGAPVHGSLEELLHACVSKADAVHRSASPGTAA